MNISLWRYSHLLLAVSSFLFLTIASVSGLILSFEPVKNRIESHQVAGFNDLTLAQVIPALKKAYPEVSLVEVDNTQSVMLKGGAFEDGNARIYVHPLTGEKLGTVPPQSAFFEWVTDFHRSLFLHELGRLFVGITAFLFLLISISGTLLVIQRQRGVKNFFKKIAKDSLAQYYHVVLSRWSLVPILIIACTGTYLSMQRFELIPTSNQKLSVDFDAIKSSPTQPLTDIPSFKSIHLSEVKSIEFPFSEDVEDYYTLKLQDRELAVNQVTGEVLNEVKYPFTQVAANVSLDLHTGRSNVLWAIILALVSCNILFFIGSGFTITFKRRAGRSKNKYKADECRFVTLVGSENGSTWSYATAFHQQLIQQGEKAYLVSLNDYTGFPKAEYLTIFTATYGLGEAPTNAHKFQQLVAQTSQTQAIKFSVVAFGSKAYEDFCQFGFDVHQLINKQSWASPLLDIHTVNDKSVEDYALWTEAWTSKTGIAIQSKVVTDAPKDLQTLEVISNALNKSEDVFLLRLKPQQATKVQSGDLLAIYPANDHRERLYSIGMVDDNLQLSVRLHPQGLGSSFLHQLTVGETMKAKIVRNEHFHFPKNIPSAILICNGTGIGPFLGMISQNNPQTSCYLYAGFRDETSIFLYKEQLDDYLAARKLTRLQLAFSRMTQQVYVGDLIKRDAQLVAEVLANKGVIMICGSLAMQKDVMQVIDSICQEKLKLSANHFQAHQQILSDCY